MGGRKKHVKSRGAGRGGGKRTQKRVGRNFGLWERIRWRVLDLTPNTPGPAASADYLTYTILGFLIIIKV